MATLIDESTAAALFIGFILGPSPDLALVIPGDRTITKQLIVIGLPRMAEGLEILVEFPFNAILLSFGTEVNAAYHFGRRLYQQVGAPLSRGLGVEANVMAGQAVGRDDHPVAYYNGGAIAGLELSRSVHSGSSCSCSRM